METLPLDLDLRMTLVSRVTKTVQTFSVYKGGRCVLSFVCINKCIIVRLSVIFVFTSCDYKQSKLLMGLNTLK